MALRLGAFTDNQSTSAVITKVALLKELGSIIIPSPGNASDTPAYNNIGCKY
jgi:hypothetical protein